MATTSIWRVKGWLGKVMIYVENPDKTENPAFYEAKEQSERALQNLSDVIEYAVNSDKTKLSEEPAEVMQQFVSGINCYPGTAREEMLAVKKRFGKEDGTVAYHGYQSFAPGEATPEMAHEIGVKLAAQLWGERYQVVVATHLDWWQNALLILAQMPEATQLKDFDGWKDAGASIKRQQKGISILEPGEEYEREDGTRGTSYNVKKVFDVSQTTARAKAQPMVNMDDRMLLKALISHPPVPLQTTDEMPGNAGAFYDHNQQVIFVRRGMDAPSIFRSVSMELARAELAGMDAEYSREKAAFPAYCASYMLCRKYGVDTNGYRFERMTEHFRDSNPQEIRSDLTEIRDTAANISARMSRALEQNRQRGFKEQER